MYEKRDKAFEEWLIWRYPCFSPARFATMEEHRKWIQTNTEAFNAGWKARKIAVYETIDKSTEID